MQYRVIIGAVLIGGLVYSAEELSSSSSSSASSSASSSVLGKRSLLVYEGLDFTSRDDALKFLAEELPCQNHDKNGHRINQDKVRVRLTILGQERYVYMDETSIEPTCLSSVPGVIQYFLSHEGRVSEGAPEDVQQSGWHVYIFDINKPTYSKKRRKTSPS